MKGNLARVQGMDTGRFLGPVVDSKSSYVGVGDMKPGGLGVFKCWFDRQRLPESTREFLEGSGQPEYP